MEASQAISESEMFEQCMSFIKRNIVDCLKSKDFPTLSFKTLKDIIVTENFTVKEEVLYENLMRWAEAECRRQTLDVSWENKRKVLGDILYKVRFPQMESEYFSRNIATTDLLSDAEKVDVMLYHTTRKDIVPKYFPVSDRALQVMRCGRVSAKSSVCMIARIPSLAFTVSHDSLLHGILVYGCNSGICEYSVKVNVRDCAFNAAQNVLRCADTKINTSSHTKVYQIMFESSLPVKAHTNYWVFLDMYGNTNTYRGENEMNRVSYGVKKYANFSHTTRDGIDKCYGQIPGLLLS